MLSSFSPTHRQSHLTKTKNDVETLSISIGWSRDLLPTPTAERPAAPIRNVRTNWRSIDRIDTTHNLWICVVNCIYLDVESPLNPMKKIKLEWFFFWKNKIYHLLPKRMVSRLYQSSNQNKSLFVRLLVKFSKRKKK